MNNFLFLFFSFFLKQNIENWTCRSFALPPQEDFYNCGVYVLKVITRKFCLIMHNDFFSSDDKKLMFINVLSINNRKSFFLHYKEQLILIMITQ